MQIGSYTIEQLSEGLFEISPDGSFKKRKSRHSRKHNSEDYIFLHRTPASLVGIDPILIKGSNAVILLDTGLGSGLDARSSHPDVSNIKTNLEIFDIDAADVTHIVLSHMHVDHVAGLTYNDSEWKTRATFPNAKIFVQHREWDFALNAVNKTTVNKGIGYKLDELYRLVADKKIHFIEDDFYRLVEGIDLIWTGGHTPGHQIVRISDADKHIAYYFGDLIPSDEFLNYTLRNMDEDHRQTRQMKMTWLRRAYQEEAHLLFYHSKHIKSGKLTKDRYRKYVLDSKEK